MYMYNQGTHGLSYLCFKLSHLILQAGLCDVSHVICVCMQTHPAQITLVYMLTSIHAIAVVMCSYIVYSPLTI